jgi:hypothetical protein
LRSLALPTMIAARPITIATLRSDQSGILSRCEDVAAVRSTRDSGNPHVVARVSVQQRCSCPRAIASRGGAATVAAVGDLIVNTILLGTFKPLSAVQGRGHLPPMAAHTVLVASFRSRRKPM